MENYEFTQTQNDLFTQLSKEVKQLGLALVAVAVLLLAYLGVQFAAPEPALGGSQATWVQVLDYGIWGMIAALVVGQAVLLWRLLDPIRKITTTSGKDIANLMVLLQQLAGLAKTSRVGAFVVSGLLLVSVTLSLTVL